jgi:hypothetical protein
MIMDENKERFCEKLGELIGRYTRNIEVEKIEYLKDDYRELAVIHFINGYTKKVCITGNSCLAIMDDVYNALI